MAKIYDYIIVLRKQSFKLIDSISKLMLLLSVAAFLFTLYLSFQGKAVNMNTAWMLFIIISAIIGWWIYCLLLEQRGGIPYYRFALMFAAWGWFLVPNGLLLAGIFLIACLIEKPVKVDAEIAFDTTEIVFNSFPKKIYTWQEMNNVVLKDGLITIDLKSNKLIQRYTADATEPELETEFNRFCQEQLSRD